MMKDYLRVFMLMLSRDLTLMYRNKSELVNPLMFFIIVIVLFPLAFGSDTELLKRLMSGIIWVTALLSTCLSLETVFRSDFEDGSIEQLSLSPYPLTLIVSAKITAHWLGFGLPLILVALLTAFVLSLSNQTIIALCLTLLLSTPVMSLIGAITVALTIGLRGGMLLSLLVLPLYMPVLIFSMLAVQNASVGQSIAAELYFLAGILVLAVTLAPIATAAALRIRLS